MWDSKDKYGSHSDLVEMLAIKNIHSTYHKYLKQEQGKEMHPTFYLYRNKKSLTIWIIVLLLKTFMLE